MTVTGLSLDEIRRLIVMIGSVIDQLDKDRDANCWAVHRRAYCDIQTKLLATEHELVRANLEKPCATKKSI